MSNENKVVREYKDVKDEYAFNPSICTKDNEREWKLKYIINNKLSLVDKTIIILYCECQSYRKLGAKMGLSHMTIRKEVLRIKSIIINEYKKLKW